MTNHIFIRYLHFGVSIHSKMTMLTKTSFWTVRLIVERSIDILDWSTDYEAKPQTVYWTGQLDCSGLISSRSSVDHRAPCFGSRLCYWIRDLRVVLWHTIDCSRSLRRWRVERSIFKTFRLRWAYSISFTKHFSPGRDWACLPLSILQYTLSFNFSFSSMARSLHCMTRLAQIDTQSRVISVFVEYNLLILRPARISPLPRDFTVSLARKCYPQDSCI